MELYKAEPASVSLMMLGCDMASQETYLNMLSGSKQADESRLTDFIVKKVKAEDESEVKDHTVKVYSNPYGAATEVPQATFNKADGFFLVYDATKAESV